jgi:hypothetical protein
MNNPMSEKTVYQAVLNGEIEIDSQGRIWRVGKRGWDRWKKCVCLKKCKRVRAEHLTPQGYLQIRVMFDKKRIHLGAHRLVYYHFFGPIPKGMTINHKNGIRADNNPGNIELATYAEQTKHAIDVLGHHSWMRAQNGEANLQAKLTNEAIREIYDLREQILLEMKTRHGKKISELAKKYNVGYQCIWDVVRGRHWESPGV